ncbi:hypothetical protein TRAPUB_2686 [Trametes pubescens]|uniref:Uncharacterized protein n=1 Tax=Trametes pubescens TaxID=154538 RepID=A0A1M2VFJ2_TRAPU|nr:hypothetical protein TRAPUB_2686 [Trametes pubescens]
MPSFWQNFARRRRPACSKRTPVHSVPSSAPVSGSTAGPSRISQNTALATVFSLVSPSPSPSSSHSSNKRPRSSDVDDSDVPPPHKKARSSMDEAVVPETAPSGSSQMVVSGRTGPAVAGTTESVSGLQHDGKAEADREEADDGAVAGDYMVPGDNTASGDDTAQEDNVAPEDAPMPPQWRAYTPRPRRTDNELAAVTVACLTLVQCGVAGCTELLNPTEDEKNRPHMRSHHAAAATASTTPLGCVWAGCGTSVSGKKMTRHVEKDHIGYGYFCPGLNCPLA